MKYRLLKNDSTTVYDGTFISLDASNNIAIINESPLSNTVFYIQAYVDENDSPECSFILPLVVPLLLEICGTEIVIVEDREPWNFTLEVGTDKNLMITNVSGEFAVSQPSNCYIALYELWPEKHISLNESGPTQWS